MSSCHDFPKDNSFMYYVLKDADGDEVEQFMFTHFYPREPINMACGSEKSRYRPYIKSDFMSSGVSVAATSKNTNTLAGVLLSYMETRDQKMDKYDDSLVAEPCLKKLYRLMKHLMTEAYDVFSDPNVNKILNVGLLSVSPAYGGKGLGYNLTKMCEDIGRSQGCQIATAQAMNPLAQNIFEKLGYKTVYSIHPSDLEVNGEKMFQQEFPSNTALQVLIKQL